MERFKKEEYGKPISQELCMYLSLQTNAIDYKEASKNTGVPLGDVTNLVCSCTPVTPENECVIVELMRLIAVRCSLKFATLKMRLNHAIEDQIDVMSQEQIDLLLPIARLYDLGMLDELLDRWEGRMGELS